MAKAKKRTPGRTTRRRLPEYEAKRDFTITPEPAPGRAQPSAEPTFMVHKHHATRMHYDLRLEIDGALASWAVPKGPSYDPDSKRLAVQTEDHPLEYGSFEGRIPDGEYGAGDSLIWDRGTFDTVPPGQASAMRKKGHIHFELHGQKLQGGWHLVRTRGGVGTKSQWLLFKAKDSFADKTRDVVSEEPASVKSGRNETRGPERRSAAAHAPHGSPETLLERVFPPMLATLVSEPPEDADQWLYEVKYDGFRAVCALSGGRVQMWTRNRLDLNERFPEVAQALARVQVGDAVIDGELVALDAKGASRFGLLQQHSEDTLLVAFDLLWLDGRDLREEPLERRRDLLVSLLSNQPPILQLAERVDGTVEEALAKMTREKKEGLIAKRRGSTYVGARSRDWLKLKVQQTQEAAVIGYLPSKASDRFIGSLLLGVEDRGQLRFAGAVGTGFSTAQRAELKRALDKTRVDRSAASDAPRLRDATWVEPTMVAQVRFTEWTSDGRLRHPAFLGMRDDKAPDETAPELPKAPPKPKRGHKSTTKKPATRSHARADDAQAEADDPPAPAQRRKHATPPAKADDEPAKGSTPRKKATSRPATDKAAHADAAGLVTLTKPDKVLYPKDGYTKQDVADYYAAVAEPLLNALADRPLALQHWPDGIDGSTFFRQSILAHDKQPWMQIASTPTNTRAGTAEHLVADSPTALRWLAQRATLALHMWSSRTGSLDQPDWVVFDLDPGEGHGLEQAIPVAQALRKLFEQLALPSVPKTTGKRGLHVLVPLLPGHTHEDAVGFAVQVGQAITSVMKEATMERTIAKRHGRLYLDCHQNGYGKTIIAPYSLRALDGATVSAPLKWSEIDDSLDIGKFTLATMPKRLDKVGDLFAPALTAGVRLPRFKDGKR